MKSGILLFVCIFAIVTLKIGASDSYNTQFCQKVVSYFQEEAKRLNFVEFSQLIKFWKVKESLREKEFLPEEVEGHVHELENIVPNTPQINQPGEEDKNIEPYQPKLLEDDHSPEQVCQNLFEYYVTHCTEQLKDVMSGRQVTSTQSKKYKMRKILKRKNLYKEPLVDDILNHVEEHDWESICVIFANHQYNGENIFYNVEDDDDDEERLEEWNKLKKKINKELKRKEDL